MATTDVTVAGTAARLNQLLNRMISKSKDQKKLQAGIMGISQYTTGIFQLSEVAARIPRAQKLNRLSQIRYFYKLAGLMNKLPPQFRAKDNQLKVAFDYVVLSANALTKVDMTNKVSAQIRLNKSMAVFTKYAAKVIIKNIRLLDAAMVKKGADPKQIRMFRDFEGKILNQCSFIAGHAAVWEKYDYRTPVNSVPEVSVAALGLLFAWGMLSSIMIWNWFQGNPVTHGLIFIPGAAVFTEFCVGIVAIGDLVKHLGYEMF
jgi:hypothetical protein